MLPLIIDACKDLLSDASFWILAAMSDASFEEGQRNEHFRGYIDGLRIAGIDSEIANQLGLGINGNLQNAIANMDRELKVVRNPSRVPDLEITDRLGVKNAKIEVKMTFDMTLPKYYRSIAADREKLRSCRQVGYKGDLFHIVFLIQLPSYWYPEYHWKPLNATLPGRSPSRGGIGEQWARICREIPDAPTFPLSNAPYCQQLKLPTANLTVTQLKRYWDATPATYLSSFEFTPELHLRNAAVGLAIWQL